MSDARTLAPHRPELAGEGIGRPGPRWLELATSSDHKDVGRMFIAASLSFLALGLVGYLMVRLQLAVPENGLIEPITFNRLLTSSTTSLVVLFALPLAVGFFTYLVPLQIGARSLAFPRLANLAFWLYLAGGAALYASFVYTPPESGPIAFPPLSDVAFISNNGVDVWVTAVGLTTLAMVLQAINLLATVRRMRAPGLAWRRLPSFSFAATVCSYLLLFAGPAMLAGLTMLEIDRHFGGVFFDAGEGGAPSYFQHLSWIFFTAGWLVMVLFAIGVISEIVPTFSRKPLPSRAAVAGSMAALGALGMLAWMQNMFSASIPVGWLYLAMAAALLALIPIGIVFLNWLGTMALGAIETRAPMLFALASISTLSFGLAAELCHSVIPVSWLISSTTDATAATGYVLVGGPVLAGIAALHYWFPKLTGRVMGESLARVSLLLILAGAHLTFIPMFLAGLEGQPVDVFKYYEGMGVDGYNLISTLGFVILAAGIVVSLANAIVSIRSGVRVGPDPWRGATLEWLALSPPPVHNFDVVPDVRSDEPMRDIRDAIAARESAPRRAEATEPVA